MTINSLLDQASISPSASHSSGGIKVAGNRTIAQIYQAGRTGQLTSLKISVDYTGGATSLRAHIAIRDVVDGKPGSTVLGEITAGTKDALWTHTFTLPTSIAQDSGTAYAIVVDYPGGGGDDNFVWTGASGTNSSQPSFSGDGGAAAWSTKNYVLDFATWVTAVETSSDASAVAGAPASSQGIWDRTPTQGPGTSGGGTSG